MQQPEAQHLFLLDSLRISSAKICSGAFFGLDIENIVLHFAFSFDILEWLRENVRSRGFLGQNIGNIVLHFGFVIALVESLSEYLQ